MAKVFEKRDTDTFESFVEFTRCCKEFDSGGEKICDCDECNKSILQFICDEDIQNLYKKYLSKYNILGCLYDSYERFNRPQINIDKFIIFYLIHNNYLDEHPNYKSIDIYGEQCDEEEFDDYNYIVNMFTYNGSIYIYSYDQYNIDTRYIVNVNDYPDFSINNVDYYDLDEYLSQISTF